MADFQNFVIDWSTVFVLSLMIGIVIVRAFFLYDALYRGDDLFQEDDEFEDIEAAQSDDEFEDNEDAHSGDEFEDNEDAHSGDECEDIEVAHSGDELLDDDNGSYREVCHADLTRRTGITENPEEEK
ncbi:probable DNA-directed RNA polymerase subunit delta isoform X2 [Argiope bruennichi]|uniref:probable DNA-directed RNA polymerase subunit delta isoform X2 n=1 Tax=Argiope bruennichi TaxID=94029 RepID=UPI0024942028|nr:probable DNA-directed RNA polymerase subunit delta isoform X2 [Argiope bruennichi]